MFQLILPFQLDLPFDRGSEPAASVDESVAPQQDSAGKRRRRRAGARAADSEQERLAV